MKFRFEDKVIFDKA